MPPENALTFPRARSSNPAKERPNATRSLSRAPERPYIRPQKTRFSCADISPYKATSCGTTPMLSLTLSGCSRTEWPATVALPAVGARRQESMEIVVVLPAPFGPSREKISPCRTAKLTPLTASRSP